MDRVYLQKLIEWNKSEDRKPLLVLGARQVGKTYLIEELFAKRFYEGSYLRIDLSDDNEFVEYALANPTLSKVLEYIQVRYDFIPDKNHLLIFDEAQECLPIIQMMKHFCEKRRDIPLIVSGSLVRIRLQRQVHKRGGFANKSFLFPVGKINQLMIYPLTFNEFLLNYKKATFEYLKERFLKRDAIPDAIHEELMEIFDGYLFVGGMPEVVSTFIKNKENKLLAYNKVYEKTKEIYSDYLSDMELYQASQESILKSRLIYRNVYSQLNKENKNFKCSQIDPKFKNRDVMTPIEWLITANVVNKSYLLKERVTSPLIESDESLYRLYLSDMGAFTYQSGMNARSFCLDKKNALSGIFYENYLSTELVEHGQKLFYWKGKRDSEFEFILDLNGRIVPLDAKKSKGSLNSIKEFRSHNATDIVIKVSKNKYGFDEENKILTIPYYCFSLFLDYGINEI